MRSFNLPDDYKPYIDKYFLRAKEILQKENLNPIVKAQVFIRKGDCKLYGIDEAIAIIMNYASNNKLIKIHALQEGDHFEPRETLMTIEAPIQEIIDLETMYLGVLSAETTTHNDNRDIDFVEVEKNMKQVVDLVDGRPVSYFGARHWRYDADFQIAAACFRGGAKTCSTDIGGSANATKGMGTIPHALQVIYHWKYGLKKAVVESTKAFDRHMNKEIPRIALIDYANREISDTILTVNEIPHLSGIRIDTCGENVMQGCFANPDNDNMEKFIFDKGVCVLGTTLLRDVLKTEGNYKIMLSSGFGNPEKVKAFLTAEKDLGYKIFDGLGVGGVFESRMATMDIISVDGQKIHKVGRIPRLNEKLKQVV